MKRAWLWIIVVSMNPLVKGQSVIDKAKLHLENQQYATAFQVLESADPNHQSPQIVIQQTQLLLNYYIRSEKHLKFALQDLKPNESLDSLRMGKEEVPLFAFRIDSLIYRLLEKEPDNLQLHLALGRYFLEVYQKYGGEAFYPEQMLLTRMEMHCALAYKRGAKDEYSTYALALKKLLDKEPIQAIPFLEDHLALNPTNAEAHFNLALAYQLQKRRSKSIQSALNALELFEEPALKAEVARMIAISYAELSDTNRSLEFLRLADQIEPQNYFTLKYLLQTEALVDSAAFVDTRQRFFRIGPDRNGIYQDLYRLHLSFNWEQSLIDFYQSELEHFKTDTLVRAKLFLHQAILHKDLDQMESCDKAVSEALTNFHLIYKPSHDVFRFIDSYFRSAAVKE